MDTKEAKDIISGVTYRPGTSVRLFDPDRSSLRLIRPTPASERWGVLTQIPVRTLQRRSDTLLNGHKHGRTYTGLDFLQSNEVFDSRWADTTRDELLNAIYVAILKAETHEIMEALRYNGRCIIDPHPGQKGYVDPNGQAGPLLHVSYKEISGFQHNPGVPVFDHELVDPTEYVRSAR